MTLYRFLFAPVLLAVAVLTSGPRRSPPAAPRPVAAEAVRATGDVAATHVPARAVRLRSHPVTVP